MKKENAITAFLFLNAVLSGWALSILWKWFVAPIFEIRNISIPEAIGILLIIAYLTHQSSTNKDQRDYPHLKSIGSSILKQFSVVFIGWVVKLFI